MIMKMLVTMTIIAGLVSLIVVGAVAILAILARPIPDVLANWGGVIIGFYFGGFISLAKDLAGVGSSGDSQPKKGNS